MELRGTAPVLIQVPSAPSDFNYWFPPYDQLSSNPDKKAQQLQHAFERFSMEALYTVDEHDKLHPRKPLPLYGHLQYLRVPIFCFMRYKRLYWCKSRKTAATTTLTELVTWSCHYWQSQLWGWITQKLDDGQFLVERYIKRGYLEMVPEHMKKRFTYGQSKGNLVIESFDDKPWDSKLAAYPSGADQARQSAHSGIVIDEAHTIENLPDVVQGAAPGLRARAGVEGGKMIIVFPARRGAPVERYIGPRGRAAIALANERLTPLAVA